MRNMWHVALFFTLILHATAERVVLQDEVVEAPTGLPELADLALLGTTKVLLPDINFTLASPLAWPTEPPPTGSQVFYKITHKDVVLGEGSFEVADEDGNFVTETEFGPYQISGTGSQSISVDLSFSETFLEPTSTTTYDGFSIVAGLTVLPPIVAILLAFATGDVLTSLFVGVWVAAFLTTRYNPASALLRTLDTYITDSFATDYRVQIILLSWFMSAMVTMLYKGGGGPGLASLFARASKTRRGVQFSAFLLGCCVFFDDYSNILLTGMAMRPLTDLVHISREKLAFSVHSCATALASISPLSSWIGFEISLIDQAYSSLIDNGADLEGKGWTTSAFVVFVKSIPARFYPIVVLTFLVSLIIYNREWGPMLTREREALREGKIVGDDVKDDPGTALDPAMEPEADTPLLWWNGLIPIVTTIGLVILGLCLTGRETAIADGLEPTAVNMFGNADSFRALLWGSFGGVVSCFFLFLLQHKHNGRLVPPSWLRWCLPCCHPVKESKPIMSWAECMHWFVEGVKSLTTAVLTLILAWSLGMAMEACGTGLYISNALGENVDPGAIPVIVFLLAAVISFATGTSWGTMAILFPIAVPTQYTASPDNESLMILTIAAILAGAIFGDQTTLISDSCILTCLSCKCDIRAHVRTQLPYALVSMFIATLLGYLPCGMAVDSFPNYAGLLVGMAAAALFAFLLSVPVDSDKIDPLTRLFGRIWKTDKLGTIAAVPGFLTHSVGSENLVLGTSATAGSIPVLVSSEELAHRESQTLGAWALRPSATQYFDLEPTEEEAIDAVNSNGEHAPTKAPEEMNMDKV